MVWFEPSWLLKYRAITLAVKWSKRHDAIVAMAVGGTHARRSGRRLGFLLLTRAGARGYTCEAVGTSFGVPVVDACRRAGMLEESRLSLDCVGTAVILASAVLPLRLR